MAYYSIETRLRADGTPRYRCTVGVKKNGKYVYRENRTFSKHAHAKKWGVSRVVEIDTNGIPNAGEASKITVAELIQKYLTDPNAGGKSGKDKIDILTRLIKSDLAAHKLSELKSNHVVDHCRYRISTGISPATVSHDISYLNTVLESANPIYGIDYTDNPIKIARPLLKQMELIGKSQRRSRRPASEEIALITKELKRKESSIRSTIPYIEIFNFSILTCMRIGEICRILWCDVDEKQKSVIVRDRKDPRKKKGNHMHVPLLGEAWNILNRQPKVSDRIFPYNSRTISVTFSKMRTKLEIDDLRYHDMRREGASRLFEAGFSIEEVAQVTGHRNLNLLWQVYTELYPKSLHEKFETLQNKNNK
ncbi:site-specific integrase [Serratia sp. MF2]|uniref:tyrosine-type recombinase/integrase n=1 Tax=Serratia sp. MF1(2023) TaxID=3059171 RepID=UPI0027EECB54|nr:site-specific integrase [Serratia sp. MF1(2023)]MDQ7104224.1 site-specific integrase [Serratia sp. MF1(2023)]